MAHHFQHHGDLIPAPEGVKEVDPSKALLGDLTKFTVVDVREPSERAETGFVPTSINVPLASIVDGTAKVPDDKPVILVCGGGRRSMKAAIALKERGYKDLTNLTSGTGG
jgi:rhodanese-related sulfurtransferase